MFNDTSPHLHLISSKQIFFSRKIMRNTIKKEMKKKSRIIIKNECNEQISSTFCNSK